MLCLQWPRIHHKIVRTSGGKPLRVFLLGILGGKTNDEKYPGETYFPFAFLVFHRKHPSAPIEKVWCYYYKDTRSTGGSLKPGSGPGGPPMFAVDQFFSMAKQLGLLTGHQVLIEPPASSSAPGVGRLSGGRWNARTGAVSAATAEGARGCAEAKQAGVVRAL